MARTYPFTEARKEKWEREGRGTGSGDTWNPWLHRGDFSSRGIATIDSLVGDNGREIHTLSSQERTAWQIYNCSPALVTAEEQVPYDREVSRRFAREMGISHPRDPESGVDIVVTTDVIVTMQQPTGRPVKLARSVKPEHELQSPNQAEHAELEKRLAAHVGIQNFAFLIERSFPAQLAQNADLLYMHRDLHKQTEPLKYGGSFEYVSSEVRDRILAARTDAPLSEFCITLNRDLKWPPGLALRAALHLIRWHKLTANLLTLPIPAQSVLEIARASGGPSIKHFGPRAA